MGEIEPQSVWVFLGSNATHPAGVFSSREVAENWIEQNGVVGVLTKYPLDCSAYDLAIRNGWFSPGRDDQKTPRFIQRFTSASQEHYHYGNDDPATAE